MNSNKIKAGNMEEVLRMAYRQSSQEDAQRGMDRPSLMTNIVKECLTRFEQGEHLEIDYSP